MEINSTTEVLLSVSGALLFCLGFVLRYWSFCYEKKDRYILDGPYRYVRNPVELGNICFCIATGLILHANPFFIAAMTLLGIIYFNIISIIYENNCFLALGAMFLRYKGRVHRWIPSRLPGINRSQESLQLLRGLHQSYSSFLFFSGVLFVIALRNHLQLGEHSVRFMTKLFQILD